MPGAKRAGPTIHGSSASLINKCIDALRRNTELREWLGDYDPAAFDPAGVNRAFSNIRV